MFRKDIRQWILDSKRVKNRVKVLLLEIFNKFERNLKNWEKKNYNNFLLIAQDHKNQIILVLFREVHKNPTDQLLIKKVNKY